MSKGRIKHVFPGGNTTKGFFSYYTNIIGQEDATRIICIKGGPGVGKSSFMKKLGNEMVNQGYDVEFMHCSSDNHSLDGVVIPKIKVALLDGTAPHVVDPKNPGAVDEILHLGDYWDEEGIRGKRKEILSTNKMVGKLFTRAYKYLSASKYIYDDNMNIYIEAMNMAGINIEADNIIKDELEKIEVSNEVGQVRKLFASAITPNGLCNYLDSILVNCDNRYIIKGEPGTGTEVLLQKILEACIEKGLDTEAYFCTMAPEKRIEHLVIPALRLAFTTLNKYHSSSLKANREIDLNQYLDNNILEKHSESLQYNSSAFDDLLHKAISTIREAKEEHDFMETFYIPHMKFKEIDICYEKVLNRVLNYAREV